MSFLNFLRGMETTGTRLTWLGKSSFLNFLRGMETREQRVVPRGRPLFLNFLRGMETGGAGPLRHVLHTLPKLP